MIDHLGIEWLPIDSAARVARVKVETIRVWRKRGKVQAFGERTGVYVHMPSLLDAEHAWRVRIAKRGARV